MGLGVNGAIARMEYQNALKIVSDAGLDPAKVKLTQNTIRLEQQLSLTKSVYQFAVLDNNNGPSGTLFNTEVRLTQQDSHITSQISVFLGSPASAVDTTFIDCTYPSPAVFAGAGVAAAYETIYKSKLKITVNNDVKVTGLHLGRFRSVPQSQRVVAAANQNGIARDQVDMSTDSGMSNQPNVILVGSKGTIIEVFLPAALTAVGAFDRLIIEFRGHLAQNSTIIV